MHPSAGWTGWQETQMTRKTHALRIAQIVDWNEWQYGTHYALLDGSKVIARAVDGVTLADLQAAYRAAKAVRP